MFFKNCIVYPPHLKQVMVFFSKLGTCNLYYLRTIYYIVGTNSMYIILNLKNIPFRLCFQVINGHNYYIMLIEWLNILEGSSTHNKSVICHCTDMRYRFRSCAYCFSIIYFNRVGCYNIWTEFNTAPLHHFIRSLNVDVI